jgi:urocanate reductase
MKSGNPSRLETQVVIIGAGGAGMAAAVTAAEKGADVIVLEKLRDLGE